MCDPVTIAAVSTTLTAMDMQQRRATARTARKEAKVERAESKRKSRLQALDPARAERGPSAPPRGGGSSSLTIRGSGNTGLRVPV